MNRLLQGILLISASWMTGACGGGGARLDSGSVPDAPGPPTQFSGPADFAQSIKSGSLVLGSPLEAAAAQAAIGDITGLRLEPRDGWGPFFIRTSPLVQQQYPPAEDFPSSEWACDKQQVYAPAGIVAILWSGCRVDHLDRLPDPGAYAGDFDVAALFVRRDATGVELRMWVDNRLEVGIDRFRYVMRVAGQSLPVDPADMRALFGYDDYIDDPLHNLRKRFDNIAWLNQVASFEGDTGRHFVRNRAKVSSMMSVHTPAWGFVLHGTDPDNADPGWLVLGSNPNEDDILSIEFGYEYKLQGEYVAGNGTGAPMQMGPALRGSLLAAGRPLDTAWWEALDAYVPFLEDESNLLPGYNLKTAAYPAQWAQECLFAAWNVTGDDLSYFLGEFRAVAEHYASADGEPLVFCPLLWGFHSVAPRVARPPAVALLAQLRDMAAELNVEFHPGAYYLPWVADLERLGGHPIEDAILYKANGQPYDTGEGTVMVAQNHQAVIDHVMDTIDQEYDLGIEYVYHDNPFREMVGWTEWAESKRDYHVNTRRMIQAMVDRLTQNGGGLVAIEGGRLGLNSTQAGANGITYSLIPGGQPSSFADALFHGRHLTAFSGDIVGESLNIAFADQRARAYLCPVAEDTPCPYDIGIENNVDHMPRLAMTAALGRSVIDPMPDLRRELRSPGNPEWLKKGFENYLTALRNAYWTRRRTPALRTGRMLPTPPSDAPQANFGSRPQTLTEPLTWDYTTTMRRMDFYPAGLFEDVETAGKYVLVVGNANGGPDGELETVRFTLDAGDYAELIFADVSGAIATVSDDGRRLTLEVTVPPLGFTVVELTTPLTE